MENNLTAAHQETRAVAPEGGTKVSERSFGLRFTLTNEVVISKQHSALFTNQAFSFNPGGKEDLKWSMIARKTPLLRTDGERGFLFCGPGKYA